MKVFLLIHLFLVIIALSLTVSAARLKDISNIRGVRENQLVGYGLVVGLKGTGDSKLEFTNKSMDRMLDKLGVNVAGKEVAGKNVAAVLITAKLPAFARAGNTLDISVNSIGDATSLVGGTLVQSPLRAADQQIYAVAQGSILVGGSEGKGHTTAGRIPNGAIIEKDVGQGFAQRQMYRITLNNPDFTTAARAAKSLNLDLGGQYASAKDGATIDLIVPSSYEGKGVELLATIESVEVTPDNRARVTVNEKTGTVIIGEGVKVSQVAISHGDLVVRVEGQPATPVKKNDQTQDRIAVIGGDVNVGVLVKALNRLGVSPKDLITILQNLKAVGALHADLEIL